MIIAIIIALIIFSYSIYQTKQYNKLEDKYNTLQLELESSKFELESLELKYLTDVSEVRLKQSTLNTLQYNYDTLQGSFRILHKQYEEKLDELNKQLEESKTPVVIEPVITVDDATEVVKSKRERKVKS